ncbi:MAG: hypothetical protein K2R98_12130 [Gemmataceae bacterium]|nr:hypothetical protein [Gemmataceae bacterium]
MKRILVLAMVVALFSVAGTVRADEKAKPALKATTPPAAANAGKLTLKFETTKTEAELSGKGSGGKGSFSGGKGYGCYSGGKGCYNICKSYCGYNNCYNYGCYSSCYQPCTDYCYQPCYQTSYQPCYQQCYTPCYSSCCYKPCHNSCCRSHCGYKSCCGSIGTLSAGYDVTPQSTVARTDATLKLPASFAK